MRRSNTIRVISPVPVPERGDRASGILLHPTSLPGGPIGSLGSEARGFVDWLAAAGQSYWQVLPLVDPGEGGSPYNGLSAFAGNPLLIDLEELVGQGLLTAADARSGVPSGGRYVDFDEVGRWKWSVLRRAHGMFRAGRAQPLRGEYDEFRTRSASWLEDYSLFRALRARERGRPWSDWEPAIRSRDPGAMAAARAELEEEVELHSFLQFLLDRQWSALRGYAAERGIRIIGDLPIFVAHDSADVWAHPGIFKLGAAGSPELVSGVPPDYFSATGQRWGNPLYRWDVLRGRGYDWWIERIRRTLEWVDLVRIDHFRGFAAAWEIPAESQTALIGEWVKGPGLELFRAIENAFGSLPLIAEDLGLITPDVEELRDALGLPGMRVLQFAFDGDPKNPHLPENHPANIVVYTGTHDNDTTVGWWESAPEAVREEVRERLAGVSAREIHWQMIELSLASRARLAVVPAQDLLGHGAESRMNTPGTTEGNWRWRLLQGELDRSVGERLRALTRRTDREPVEALP